MARNCLMINLLLLDSIIYKLSPFERKGISYEVKMNDLNKYIIISIIVFLSFIEIVQSEKLTWKLILKKDNCMVMKVDVLDSLDAMALIYHKGFCEVYNSIDGGESWEQIYSEYRLLTDTTPFPRPQMAYNLSHPAKNYVYIQFDLGQIRRSKDNGKTYDTIIVAPIPNPKKEVIFGFEMYDSLVGACSLLRYMPDGSPYAFTDVILFTEDGWDTWQTIKLDSILGFPIGTNGGYGNNAVKFFSKDHWGFIDGRTDSYSYFIYTKDKGKTWKTSNILNANKTEMKSLYLFSVFFINDTLGWIAAGYRINIGDQQADLIYKTTNGGETWEVNYLNDIPPVMGLQGIAFKDEMNGIAVGAWGKILRTTDGGETWVQEYAENHETDMGGNPVMHIHYFGTKPIISTRGGGYLFWKEITPSSVIYYEEQLTKVYPNPAKTNVSIDFIVEPENLPNLKVELYNLTGILQSKLDYSVDYNNSNGQGTINCNIENISNGYYIITIDNGKRKIAKPFIVNRD